MIARGRAVAAAHARDLLRRRGSLILLVALPLAFYLTSASDQYAPTFASVGVSWSIAVAALFSTLAMRAIAPRLALLGFSAADLLIGRLLAVFAFGIAVCLALWGFIVWHGDIYDPRMLLGAFAISLLISAPLGVALGALVDREMEATLLIIALVGMQLVVDTDSTLARALPAFGAEQLSAKAVGWEASVRGAVTHGVVAAAILVSIAIAATIWRQPRSSGATSG